MERRTVIAVSFLDGAAVAAALFFGLQSHPSAVVHRITVAQASPPAVSTTQRSQEEAGAREAIQAADQASRAREKRTREATRATAKAGRAQKLRAREARHAAAKSRAAEKQAGAVRPRPPPRTKTRRQKQSHGSKPKHGKRSRREAGGERQLDRERAEENRERKRSEREAAREKRRERRQSTHGARNAVP
jgi:hypothetical protein